MPYFSKKTGKGRAARTVDVQEVAAHGSAIEHRADHVARYRAHDTDERIWRLEKYVLEELSSFGTTTDPKLWPSYTSNGPRTYWNAIRRATTANGPRMRVKLPSMIDQGLDMFEEMLIETARHEHFAYGVWANIDEQRVRRGQMPFQDQIGWDLGIRGGVFVRPWFDPDAKYPFQVQIWDPKTVAYEAGVDGLEYVSHHYFAPYYSLGQVYNLHDDKVARLGTDENGNVEVQDCWWLEEDAHGEPHVWNAVYGGGQTLKEAQEFRDLDHLPIYLVRTFGADVEPNPDFHSTIQRTLDQWETIYTANRTVYPWINRILTLYGIYLRNNAVGPWFAKQTGFTEEQLRNVLKPFQVVQSPNPNSSIEPLSQPQMAQEVKEMFQHLQGEEQRGAVPYAVYGQLSFQLSGFALNQLQGSIGITAGGIAKAMGTIYRLCTDELIAQFRARGSRVTLKGMDTRKSQFIEEITASSLREKYYLEVEISAEVPTDKLQEAQVALQWKQIGIDPVTIMDEVLHIADPREVVKRMMAWQQMQLEMQMELQAEQQAEGGGVPPQLASPETMGQTQQHEEFQPSAQHMPDEALAGAGFVR